MGAAESSRAQQRGTCDLGLELSDGYVRELAVTNFAKTRATFTWHVHQLRNWPKGEFEATSPPFVHPSASRWRMHLSKDYYEAFHLGFVLISSEKGLPVRASIETRVKCKGAPTLLLPTIQSELFSVGEVKRKSVLRGFGQPKDAQWDGLLVESTVEVVCGFVEAAPGPSYSLQADLATLLKLGEDADVVVLAGTGWQQLQAHSTLLCARSPVLAAVLRSPEARSEFGYVVDMQKVEPRVAKELLRYIYTDETPALSEMVEELLALSNRYELPGLMQRCELELCRQLTVESAARTARLGVAHLCLTVLQVAVPFIEQRYGEVLGTPAWAAAVRADPEAMATVSRLVGDAAKGELKVRL